jgi:hypothetical protein
LPSSVTEIGQSAFGLCDNLDVVIEAVNPPVLYSTSFATTKNFTIYVPDASVNAYKSAEYWSTYADKIKPLSEYQE